LAAKNLRQLNAAAEPACNHEARPRWRAAATKESTMSIRRPKNAELNKAIDSLGEAAQHVRNAVQGKLDGVREAATAELARAKAVALQKTEDTQGKVERVLKKAETRLHKVILKAEKALDKAVRQAEKRSAAAAPATVVPAATVKRAAAKGAAKAAPVKKAPAAKRATVAKKAAPARKPRVA
jgi:dsDNA-specific endonuclease/ATPase MutS2